MFIIFCKLKKQRQKFVGTKSYKQKKSYKLNILFYLKLLILLLKLINYIFIIFCKLNKQRQKLVGNRNIYIYIYEQNNKNEILIY